MHFLEQVILFLGHSQWIDKIFPFSVFIFIDCYL